MALLWEKDTPIVRSSMETDKYKLTMLYYFWTYYPYLKVKWAFKNRTTSVPLANYVSISELREQCQEVEKLRFSESDISYLRNLETINFPEEFLNFLRTIRLKMPILTKVGDQLIIEPQGLATNETLWEIYFLEIIAELYGRNRAKVDSIAERALYDEGMKRAKEKINFLKKHPELKILLFGLRRRVSGPWEEKMTEMFLTEASGNIVGVSNVHLAKKFGVKLMGSIAHETAMAEFAISRHTNKKAVRESLYDVLRKWERLYSNEALVMLSDTFGTDAFLQKLPTDIASNWSGHRQDSGDPFVIGEKIIADYQSRGINPLDKKIIFSDGLDCQKMLELHRRFGKRIQVAFGWGTNHSNDLGLIKPLSIVMKLVEASGNSTVKLSDNLAKAMGPGEEIQVAKEIFGYTNEFSETTVY